MARHVVKWLGPAPLWRTAGNAPDRLARPAILRFASDSFMEDLLALLERDPDSIGELEARHETWRGPAETARALEQPIALERPPRRVLALARRRLPKGRPVPAPTRATSAPSYQLKLYQPAHQRYYLVASSLVCATAGFPDRAIDVGKLERVSFVLRRLFPRQGSVTDDLPVMDPANLSDWEEYAFTQSPSGPSWHRVQQSALGRIPGEEPLPMFPMGFQDSLALQRRVLAGMIPVAKRELYLGAPRDQSAASLDSEQDGLAGDPRRMLFVSDVIAPWKSLIESNEQAARRMQPPDGGPDDAAAFAAELKQIKKEAREKVQTGTWYLLLDFAALLEEHLPALLTALKSGDPAALSGGRREAELAIFQALHPLALPGLSAKLTNASDAVSGNIPYAQADVATGLGAALGRIGEADFSTRLAAATRNYDREANDATDVWPDFLFALADLELGPLLPNITLTQATGEDPLEFQLRRLDRLVDLITAALPPLPAGAAPAVPANARPGIDPRDGWFVIRCVYEQPECGVLHPPVLSAPTDPFQLASFFDPDAPARPIRIALPIDPSPEGLRKFDKKTFVVMSNLLCGHIDRLKQLSLADLVLSVLPFPFHKSLSVPERGPCTTPEPAGLALGMMCSLSLPIITICALILLMIIVNLLDLIFRWLPYFTICFPLPGFKGKKGAS